jgi:molecular chaperone HscB
MQLHPDKWNSSGGEQQQRAALVSATLNRAYKVLRSPLTRANYLLELKGAAPSDDEHSNDVEFLMEVIEARETIDDGNAEAVAQVKKETEAKISQSLAALPSAFASNDLQRAKQHVIKLKYYTRIAEACEARSEGLSCPLEYIPD